MLGRDLDVLLADLSGKSVAWVIAHGEESIDEWQLEPLIERRLRGEPLQYIRGTTEFFGHDFYVDNRVLIPRPETELLVETAIELIPRDARVLDIGVGSGAIAISVATARPDLHVFACDVSVAALAVAQRNGATRLVASDLLSAFRGRFDAILSNPPYIASSEMPHLQLEVRDHEPHMALTPGPHGTEVIERLVASAPLVIMEIGFGQSMAVREIAEQRKVTVQEIRNDLAGIPRVVVLSSHGR